MAFTTYQGEYVFSLFPIWSKAPTIGIARNYGSFGGVSREFAETLADYPYFTSENGYLLNGIDKIAEVNDLFDLLKGRWGNIWMPSWQYDFVLDADIGASDVEIQVESASHYSSYYDATYEKYLLIYVGQNKWFARSFTVSGNLLTIDSALGEIITQARCKMLCLLRFGRLDIDETEHEYIAPTVAMSTIVFKELPHEYP